MEKRSLDGSSDDVGVRNSELIDDGCEVDDAREVQELFGMIGEQSIMDKEEEGSLRSEDRTRAISHFRVRLELLHLTKSVQGN